MSFDDSLSCQTIDNLLKPNVGRSIAEFGDLEVPSKILHPALRSTQLYGEALGHLDFNDQEFCMRD